MYYPRVIYLQKYFFLIVTVLTLRTFSSPVRAATTPPRHEGYVTTPDKVKIHYIAGAELGSGSIHGGSPAASSVSPHKTPSILFVPGWTMPAWIWNAQLDHFEKSYRVVAMDPRCQGKSTCTTDGLYPAARARDIKAVVDQLKLAPVVIVGWSMAVNELVSYVDQFGTSDIAGLVFVDDSTTPLDPKYAKDMLDFVASFQPDRFKNTNAFVRSFFKKPQPEDFIKQVVDASLGTPTDAAVALLVGKLASDLTSTLQKIDKPAMAIAAAGPYAHLIQEMQQQIPGCTYEVMDNVGHAVFVDDPAKFNFLLDSFLTRVTAAETSKPE